MTKMTDIDDFLPKVLHFAPNTSDLVAYRFILEAARELCERLRIWRATDEFTIDQPLVQGVCTIRDADIEAIESAWLDGEKLIPKTIPWLDNDLPGWDTGDVNAGAARYVTQVTRNTVTVAPRATGSLRVRLILKPAEDALSLPLFLLTDYGMEIGRGAAGKVLTDPDSKNPQLGLAHQQYFDGRLDTLSTRAAKGQQGAPLRTRGKYF